MGKTTLAQIISNKLEAPFYTLSAISSGVKDVREVIEKAKGNRFFNTVSPILFIDEIHTIVGAGSTSGGSMDASNLLKPILAEGKLRCIGSTTYDEFRKKGFEIYGVSFDEDRGDWLGAVEQNGMNWLHVSEVKGFDNQAAKDYAIQGIPSNFLIDGQGTIVARNLRGEALYEKISELLAQ